MRLKKRIILITLFVGFLFIGSLSTPFLAQAQKFKPQITIPGSSFAKGASIPMGGDTTILGSYIAALYKYAISIVGIVATIMLMFGGFTWLTAGGSGEKVGKARDIIFGALTGLVLALTSYTMLTLINPDLVNFKITKIEPATGKEQAGIPDLKNIDTFFNCDKSNGLLCPDGYECLNGRDCVVTHDISVSCDASFSCSGDYHCDTKSLKCISNSPTANTSPSIGPIGCCIITTGCINTNKTTCDKNKPLYNPVFSQNKRCNTQKTACINI